MVPIPSEMMDLSRRSQSFVKRELGQAFSIEGYSDNGSAQIALVLMEYHGVFPNETSKEVAVEKLNVENHGIRGHSMAKLAERWIKAVVKLVAAALDKRGVATTNSELEASFWSDSPERESPESAGGVARLAVLSKEERKREREVVRQALEMTFGGEDDLTGEKDGDEDNDGGADPRLRPKRSRSSGGG